MDYSQTGNVITHGDGSSGIIAQSISGDGGYADGDFSGTGDGNVAGSIAFDLAGSVETHGDGSNGVMLQTIGTTSGDIDYDQTGNVLTQNDGSIGIIAQAIGGSGGFIDGEFVGARAPALAGRSISTLPARSRPRATVPTAFCCKASAAAIPATLATFSPAMFDRRR